MLGHENQEYWEKEEAQVKHLYICRVRKQLEFVAGYDQSPVFTIHHEDGCGRQHHRSWNKRLYALHAGTF